jgi:L-iditol 2-dehydrogenase
MELMKATVLRSPRETGLEEVSRPEPGPGEVLVRITHGGICGTDLKIYEGSIPVRHPLILGHEMAGVVVEQVEGRTLVGERVVVDPVLFCGTCYYCQSGLTNLCPNCGLLGRDRNGGFAEYAVVPQSHVYVLPESIDNVEAALIQVVTTCMHAQRRVEITKEQSVAVVGLGVTGQAHVQLAKIRGAHPVIGVTRSAWKRRLAEQLGADVALPSGTGAVRGVLDATNGRGADVVIECTGHLSAIADAIRMARPGASLLLFGITTGGLDPTFPFYDLYFKELRVVNARAAKSEDFPPCIDLVARGVLKLRPLITHVLPLENFSAAIEMLRLEADGRMKIVLENR